MNLTAVAFMVEPITRARRNVIRSEARWLRFLPTPTCPAPSPYLPGQSGYNKRLRTALPLLKRAIRVLARDIDLWSDTIWVIDSTPIECGRSRRNPLPAGVVSDIIWA